MASEASGPAGALAEGKLTVKEGHRCHTAPFLHDRYSGNKCYPLVGRHQVLENSTLSDSIFQYFNETNNIIPLLLKRKVSSGEGL